MGSVSRPKSLLALPAPRLCKCAQAASENDAGLPARSTYAATEKCPRLAPGAASTLPLVRRAAGSGEKGGGDVRLRSAAQGSGVNGRGLPASRRLPCHKRSLRAAAPGAVLLPREGAEVSAANGSSLPASQAPRSRRLPHCSAGAPLPWGAAGSGSAGVPESRTEQRWRG